VVIWNLIRRCNLTCRHCYALAADKDFAGELAFDEVAGVMDDLRRTGVSVLILSGGEPLMRPDIHAIGRLAKDKGFYVGLSSNGTLIDDAQAAEIAAVGYDYVGVSLDGLRARHDAFRRLDGAFDAALAGIRRCRDRGVKVGLRFTLTKDTVEDLPALLDLVAAEDIDKVYLSHLNYAGRGNHNRLDDARHRRTRAALDLLFDRCLDDLRAGHGRDYVTGNNDADGAYLYLWARDRFPGHADRLLPLLTRWGGNASGVKVGNIDNLGNVHPDTMWWTHTLGNVRERPFSAIWQDTSDPLMAGLKRYPRRLTGRCGACQFLPLCNGNTRTRAFQLTGDPWAEDPGCYLTDAEIGAQPAGARIALTGFGEGPRRPRRAASRGPLPCP
jgi:heme d1 biosynthesis radical SAM protein NirJ